MPAQWGSKRMQGRPPGMGVAQLARTVEVLLSTMLRFCELGSGGASLCFHPRLGGGDGPEGSMHSAVRCQGEPGFTHTPGVMCVAPVERIDPQGDRSVMNRVIDQLGQMKYMGSCRRLGWVSA